MVISVCFNWPLGPSTSSFSFSLAVVTVCLYNITPLLWQRKPWKSKIGCYQLLIDDDTINTKWAFNIVFRLLSLCLAFITINLVDMRYLGHWH